MARRAPRLVHDQPSRADRLFDRVTLAAAAPLLLLTVLVAEAVSRVLPAWF